MSGAPVEREPGGIDPAVGAPAPDDGIAAVVVSHRSASTLDDCLLRLRGAHGVAQIRVVDNASDDATLEIVQRHALADPRLRFIANPDNPGFAVACNQGAAASDAPWLAFVNPDLRVRPDSLARLRAHALALPAPALLGADLLGEDGVRDGAARRRDPDFAAMLRAPVSASRLELAMDVVQALQPVDAVSGATVAVANDVSVVHVRGVSSRSRPLFVEWHKHRGLWRYFRKFESHQRGLFTRIGVFAAIWMHFAASVPRLRRR